MSDVANSSSSSDDVASQLVSVQRLNLINTRGDLVFSVHAIVILIRFNYSLEVCGFLINYLDLELGSTGSE